MIGGERGIVSCREHLFGPTNKNCEPPFPAASPSTVRTKSLLFGLFVFCFVFPAVFDWLIVPRRVHLRAGDLVRSLMT